MTERHSSDTDRASNFALVVQLKAEIQVRKHFTNVYLLSYVLEYLKLCYWYRMRWWAIKSVHYQNWLFFFVWSARQAICFHFSNSLVTVMLFH